MTIKATKLAAIFSRLHSAWRLPQATLALALAFAAFASFRIHAEDVVPPEGYTNLTAGLTKLATENKILVTDCYLFPNSWMEIELEFGDGSNGNDGTQWGNSYFMGLSGLPNGHQLNGCLARYVKQGESGLMSFWCDTDTSGGYDAGGFESYKAQLTPYSGRQTLKLEYGKVTLSSDGESISAESDNLKRSGKTDGPISIFGSRYLISSQPYLSRDMTVYSWKIYESDTGLASDSHQTLKHDFYPVGEISTGKKGLYDKVTGKIFLLDDLVNVKIDFNGGYCPALADLGMDESAEMSVPPDVMLSDFPETLLQYFVPPQSNQKFGGYFTAATGGIQYYSADGKAMRVCDLDSGATLYAQWVDFQYKINYPKSRQTRPLLSRPCGCAGRRCRLDLRLYDAETFQEQLIASD